MLTFVDYNKAQLCTCMGSMHTKQSCLPQLCKWADQTLMKFFEDLSVNLGIWCFSPALKAVLRSVEQSNTSSLPSFLSGRWEIWRLDEQLLLFSWMDGLSSYSNFPRLPDNILVSSLLFISPIKRVERRRKVSNEGLYYLIWKRCSRPSYQATTCLLSSALQTRLNKGLLACRREHFPWTMSSQRVNRFLSDASATFPFSVSLCLFSPCAEGSVMMAACLCGKHDWRVRFKRKP